MPNGMRGPLSRENGCRSVDCYERLNFVDEGTYGMVFRARDIDTGDVYALKQVKMDQQKYGFPVTSLREISTLLSLSHRNVVAVREVVVGSTTDAVYIVMEYAEQDLCSLLERMRRPYDASEVKALLRQLLMGLAYLHDNWVIHRDLKPSNLLLTSEGVLKICDFGLARHYSDPLGKYTAGVVTLWYRAPELLMGASHYSSSVDMWAAGCIFAELLLMKPLFTGKGELDQLSCITGVLGAPCEERWRGYDKLPNAKRLTFRNPKTNGLKAHIRAKVGDGRVTEAALDLLERLLLYDPEKRISAEEALDHVYFSELPRPKDPALIQTFPGDHRG